jgi:hypothetical protein
VAKTRSKSRKSGASTRAKGTKKSAGKRKTAAKRAKRPARLNLKKLRRDIDRALAYLGTRALSAGPSDEPQASLERLAAEIDGICARGNCGPSMVIALA